MTCDCGKPAMYGPECRDCYEDRLRRESRDAYYRDNCNATRRFLRKERTTVRLHKNYEGPPSLYRG